MPLIVKNKFLVNNSWIQGDLRTAKEMINTIINDLNDNDETHIDYVLEKLKTAERILNNVNTLCRKSSDQGGDSDEGSSN